ncbi:hypothetical protein [Nocardia sp. NPDC051833]|uniref:hypothetical protein n=1 Tax=Nocardia sp. NPDC051833 TaxID=3155674 RepID=UPI00341E2E13
MTALSCSAIDVGTQYYEPLTALTSDGRSPRAVPDGAGAGVSGDVGSGVPR